MEMEIETSSKVADNEVSTETEEIFNRLPLHIQTHIVAILPIKHAMKSSILSKKFNSIWHSLPCLKFDFQEFPDIEGKHVIFEDFLNRTLLQHDPSTVVLLELSIGFRHLLYPKIKVEWIKFGLDHLVQHLILDGVLINHQRLPNSLFTTKSLVTLDLSLRGYVLTWPTNVFLPNLAKLKLRALKFVEENITFDFFKNSQSLKELIIWACKFINVKLVSISASVEHLVLRSCAIDTCKVRLRTPSLTYFEYKNPVASGFDFEGLPPNFSGVVHIHQDIHDRRREEDIAQCAVELFRELRNASYLFICDTFIKYLVQGEALFLNMKPILFNHLTALEVYIVASIEQYKSLLFILSRCPNLASLRIQILLKSSILGLDEVELNWKEMLHYAVFASLDYLEVVNLRGSRGEMGLVEFLLLKAREVKDINILPPKTIDGLGNIIMSISEESWSAVTAKVLEFKRASSARISFE